MKIQVKQALALLLLLFSGCSGDPRGGNRPSVILISLDTLRADHLSLYDYHRKTSPFLDQFASESVVIEQMVGLGRATLETHASMLTSLPPLVHGLDLIQKDSLGPDVLTLAEVLQASGYRTAAFTDGGSLNAKFGFDQGFDLYDDQGGHFESILPKAEKWLEENADSAFFLFLHTYDIHSAFGRGYPYECPGDFSKQYNAGYQGSFNGCIDGRCASELFSWLSQQAHDDPTFRLSDYLPPEDLEFVVGLYDGCINYVDQSLREFMGTLRRTGVFDRVLILITSDHGEEFGERGKLLHSNLPYEFLLRIPLVLKFPNSNFAGVRRDELASTLDLMPTILDYLGLARPYHLAGRSLMPLISEGSAIHGALPMLGTIRSRDWKFIGDFEEKSLFYLPADPNEKNNQVYERPEILAELLSLALISVARRETWLHRAGPWQSRAENAHLTEAELEALRSLGYTR